MSTKQDNWMLKEERCKNCSICVSFCPAGSIFMDEDGFPRQSEEVKCRECGLCERWCPDFAIKVGGGIGAK